jgi:hypothetical protein
VRSCLGLPEDDPLLGTDFDGLMAIGAPSARPRMARSQDGRAVRMFGCSIAIRLHFSINDSPGRHIVSVPTRRGISDGPDLR